MELGDALKQAYTSALAVVKIAKAILKHGHSTCLYQLTRGKIENLTCELVFKAAEQKDELSMWIVEETGRYLGIGIGSLVNVFNPEMVVLAGGMVKAGEILFSQVKKYAMLNSLKVNRENVKIVPGKLGDYSGAVGAAATVLKRKGII